MIPNCRRHTDRVVRVGLLFSLFFFITEGCKKDDSSPVIPGQPVAYPSIAGNWSGSANEPGFAYMLDATFVQNSGDFTGSWVWTINGYYTKDSLKGTITKTGQIAIEEINYVGLNWTPNTGQWTIGKFSAVLTSRGYDRDTIAGSWTSDATPLTFVLARE
jgi:hypothetical protein